MLNNTFGQNLFDQFPDIDQPFIYMQQANYDRAGLNADGFVSKTIFDTIPHGQVNNPGGPTDGTFEYVLAKITGPAVLQRFWFAGVSNSDVLRFYFDGEPAPRLEKTVEELFYQQQAPFKQPLVDNLISSSGCFVMYFPMNIADELIITLDSNFVFHQTGYTCLPKDTSISSWTPADDNAGLAALFSSSGNYPKPNAASLQTDSIRIDIGAGESIAVFTANSSGKIEKLQLEIPGLNYDYSERIFDEGNYRKGTASFRVKIGRNADSVVLINRMNKNPFFKSPLQVSMTVRVNGTVAGVWTVNDFRDYHFWDNERFKIPRSLILNKDSLTISLQYLSGRNWNEFTYWVECNGVVTDTVDVGDAASETAHQFSANGLVYDPNQAITARYLSPLAVQEANHVILDSLWIRIFFDDAAAPAVEAPVGLFFGTGSNDAAYMNALLCGNIAGRYYNYFTMPYWENVWVELENRSQRDMSDLFFLTAVTPDPGSRQTNGYFKTQFRRTTKYSNDKTDFNFLAETGKGKFCGIVIEGSMNNIPVGPLAWLEGDERIYTDDAQTPYIHGTGTEDFFNGGFYFVFDEYSRPQHGMTNSDRNYHRSMYRFFHTDPVYFRKNIRAGIEHGGANDTLGNYSSLAFYYWQPDTTYVLSDSLDVGKSTAELAHRYTVYGPVTTISKTSSFEGEKFTELSGQDGYAIKDSVEFTVFIRKQNKGVRLLRTYDYSVKGQSAAVYVDGVFAGNWSYVGSNTISQFRDDIFALPAARTRGRDSLRIRIVNRGTTWTELNYKVYTLLDPDYIPTGAEPLASDFGIRVFPNPADHELILQIPGTWTAPELRMYNVAGQLQASHALTGEWNHIPLHKLAAGTYIYQLFSAGELRYSGKLLKLAP